LIKGSSREKENTSNHRTPPLSPSCDEPEGWYLTNWYQYTWIHTQTRRNYSLQCNMDEL